MSSRFYSLFLSVVSKAQKLKSPSEMTDGRIAFRPKDPFLGRVCFAEIPSESRDITREFQLAASTECFEMTMGLCLVPIPA